MSGTSSAAPSRFANGYTQADNWLFDFVLPRARPNTFKVVAAIVRQTAGWHVAEARLTLAALQELTGIAGRGTLVGAVEDALARGFVERRPVGRSYRYRPAIVPVQAPAGQAAGAEGSRGSEGATGAGPAPAPPVRKAHCPAAPAVRKEDRPRSQNRTGSGPEIGPSSIIEKKGERKGKDIFPPGGGEKPPPASPVLAGERLSPPLGGAGPAPDPVDTPLGVYQRLSALEPGIRKGQTLAVARRLLRGDPAANLAAYSGAEIVACARFLQTDPWRIAKMVPLNPAHIVEKIGKWAAAGRPESWAAWEAYVASVRPAGGQEQEPAGFAAIRAFLAEQLNEV